MARRSTGIGLGTCVVALCAQVACSAAGGGDVPAGAPAGASGFGGSSAGGAGASGTAGSAGAAIDSGFACPSCSSDAKKVIGCDGQTSDCAATEMCVAGKCLSGCEAARVQHASVGCEYWAVDADAVMLGVNACFAVFVANTAATPAHIQVSWKGKPIQVGAAARIPSGSGPGLS
jgi:hypothetical protein